MEFVFSQGKVISYFLLLFKSGNNVGTQLWSQLFQWHQESQFIYINLGQGMKRSLAPPRREKPAGITQNNTNNSLAKKMLAKPSEDRVTSIEKPGQFSFDTEHDKTAPQKYEQRYRNKNLNTLPTQMLVTLSGLTTIDISYNHLTDSQIEMLMKSCTKLSTFCMQGNKATLIPSAISNLKQLINFVHDWVKINPHEMYETVSRLQKLKQIALKPACVVKSGKIVGIDFQSYCKNVLQVPLDKHLLEKIEKCDCSSFARTNMLKFMGDVAKGKVKEKQKLTIISQGEQRSLLPGCFGALGFNDLLPNKKRQQKWKQNYETDAESVTTSIKIEDIRDITDKEMTMATLNDLKNQQSEIYNSPGYPLHQLFANFDRTPHGPTQIDGLLIRGYNPNQYDGNGLSPYHLCVINRQKKGIQYLVQISSNNPGFFDLEMPSTKQGRNLLHYSVFMKNYYFTKLLIDFGMPIDKRDGSGARIIHLVDNNSEFLVLLRKMIKKRSHMARNISQLAIPIIPPQKKKNYTKHPQRQKQQSRFRITYSKNDKLLQLYEQATGIPSNYRKH